LIEAVGVYSQCCMMIEHWELGVLLVETAYFCHFPTSFNQTWQNVYLTVQQSL